MKNHKFTILASMFLLSMLFIPNVACEDNKLDDYWLSDGYEDDDIYYFHIYCNTSMDYSVKSKYGDIVAQGTASEGLTTLNLNYGETYLIQFGDLSTELEIEENGLPSVDDDTVGSTYFPNIFSKDNIGILIITGAVILFSGIWKMGERFGEKTYTPSSGPQVRKRERF